MGNLWVPAAMLYAKAERLFVAENRTDKALYAEVSQLPLMTSLEGFRPKFPNSHETALSRRRRMPKKDCVFSLFGECWRQIMKLGTRVTWEDVKTLALRQGHLELATGAEGEQGIAFAFLLGDTETAKKLVVRAWGLSKVERDPAATV